MAAQSGLRPIEYLTRLEAREPTARVRYFEVRSDENRRFYIAAVERLELRQLAVPPMTRWEHHLWLCLLITRPEWLHFG